MQSKTLNWLFVILILGLFPNEVFSFQRNIPSAIRPGYVFLNEPLLSKYRYYSLAGIAIIALQSFLILYLLKSGKKQKKLSERIMESDEHHELLQADRMAIMTEFTALLSHELNQPLTAILYSAQAGKRFLNRDMLDKDRANEIYDNIIEDDKRAGKIISSMRNLMKSEDRGYEKIDLTRLVLETKHIFQSEAARKNIKINLNCVSFPLYVSGDKTQLQQVMMNLIRNSFNAMEEHGTNNKTLDIILNQHKESVNVSVRDSGPGIDPGIRERLFRHFVTTRKDGSGIGLALSRSIIEKHKGIIWAENLAGGGAAFSFKLQSVKDENEKRHRFYYRR